MILFNKNLLHYVNNFILSKSHRKEKKNFLGKLRECEKSVFLKKKKC